MNVANMTVQDLVNNHLDVDTAVIEGIISEAKKVNNDWENVPVTQNLVNNILNNKGLRTDYQYITLVNSLKDLGYQSFDIKEYFPNGIASDVLKLNTEPHLSELYYSSMSKECKVHCCIIKVGEASTGIPNLKWVFNEIKQDDTKGVTKFLSLINNDYVVIAVKDGDCFDIEKYTWGSIRLSDDAYEVISAYSEIDKDPYFDNGILPKKFRGTDWFYECDIDEHGFIPWSKYTTLSPDLQKALDVCISPIPQLEGDALPVMGLQTSKVKKGCIKLGVVKPVSGVANSTELRESKDVSTNEEALTGLLTWLGNIGAVTSDTKFLKSILLKKRSDKESLLKLDFIVCRDLVNDPVFEKGTISIVTDNMGKVLAKKCKSQNVYSSEDNLEEVYHNFFQGGFDVDFLHDDPESYEAFGNIFVNDAVARFVQTMHSSYGSYDDVRIVFSVNGTIPKGYSHFYFRKPASEGSLALLSLNKLSSKDSKKLLIKIITNEEPYYITDEILGYDYLDELYNGEIDQLAKDIKETYNLPISAKEIENKITDEDGSLNYRSLAKDYPETEIINIPKVLKALNLSDDTN